MPYPILIAIQLLLPSLLELQLLITGFPFTSLRILAILHHSRAFSVIYLLQFFFQTLQTFGPFLKAFKSFGPIFFCLSGIVRFEKVFITILLIPDFQWVLLPKLWETSELLRMNLTSLWDRLKIHRNCIWNVTNQFLAPLSHDYYFRIISPIHQCSNVAFLLSIFLRMWRVR